MYKSAEKVRQIGPINHEHLLVLVEVMRFRYTHQNDKAKLYFDRAIQLARHNENSREEAIAQLNAAQFYYANEEKHKVAQYMQLALHLFYSWGAPYVVSVLSSNYHHLLQQNT